MTADEAGMSDITLTWLAGAKAKVYSRARLCVYLSAAPAVALTGALFTLAPRGERAVLLLALVISAVAWAWFAGLGFIRVWLEATLFPQYRRFLALFAPPEWVARWSRPGRVLGVRFPGFSEDSLQYYYGSQMASLGVRRHALEQGVLPSSASKTCRWVYLIEGTRDAGWIAGGLLLMADGALLLAWSGLPETQLATGIAFGVACCQAALVIGCVYWAAWVKLERALLKRTEEGAEERLLWS